MPMPQAEAEPSDRVRIHAARDEYMLRPLPGEDIYIRFKFIDNSRIVRDPDPTARKACWQAIGVSALALVLLALVLFPKVANTLAGYKLEALRAENRRLLEESRDLDYKRAQLMALPHLKELARQHNMVVPQAGQVVHMNGNGATVAMIQ
jgi:hypothetical protein